MYCTCIPIISVYAPTTKNNNKKQHNNRRGIERNDNNKVGKGSEGDNNIRRVYKLVKAIVLTET